MCPRFCPRCGSPKIRASSSYQFGLSGLGPLQYACEDCGYYGPIVLEADTSPPITKTKNTRDFSYSAIKCPSCGFENPSNFQFCGKCGTPLEEEETRIY